ncbi:MAG: uroporphyrinogen-III synthase [Bacteroidales bacterium]|nr:uroporphyrinogen-III synthase [Bacteroidales bacterium]
MSAKQLNSVPGEKSVISTQPFEQAEKLKKALEGSDISFFNLPMIRTEALPLSGEITDAIQNLRLFSLVIFTSKNGVINFWEALEQLKITFPATLKTAVIGNGTAKTLEKYHGNPGFVNEGKTSTDFAAYLKSEVISKSDKILLVQGNLAPDFLFNELSEIAAVKRIDVYQTVAEETCDDNILKEIRDNRYGLLIFSSPSGFSNFYKFYKRGEEEKFPLRILSIGNTTTEAISGICKTEIITAERPDTQGLKNEILRYFH